MSTLYKTLKDVVLNVPYLARDVDILNYRTNMAKIELYLNTINENNTLLLQYIQSIDPNISDAGSTVYVGPTEPENKTIGMVWIQTQE